MKKAFSVLAFVAFGACAFGQVVITSSNYYTPGNVARDLYIVENDETDIVPINNIASNPLEFGNSLENLFGVYGGFDFLCAFVEEFQYCVINIIVNKHDTFFCGTN